MTLLMLFAQATDPISGGAGWVGAGLLGLVLMWVFFVNLPAKDKLIRDLIADCDKHNGDIVKDFSAQVQQQRHDFQESLKFLSQQNEKYITVLSNALRREIGELRDKSGE